MTDLSVLNPQFKEKLDLVLNELPFPYVILCTDRSAVEQAKLWRRGRSIQKIKNKAKWLEKFDPRLSEILMNVGPQYGNRILTKAGPGESYHNYHKATDVAPLICGKIPWSGAHAEWSEIGRLCLKYGLVWGGNWSFKDLSHIQSELTGNPLKLGEKGCIYE